MHLFDLKDYISDGYYEDKNGSCYYLTSKYEVFNDDEVILVKHGIKQALKATISCFDFDGGTDQGHV